jgi:predicted Fe-Mo cluster-binding NifX family protein
MKIAITSLRQDLNSQIDPRFGRAAYILIVPTGNVVCTSLKRIPGEMQINPSQK